MVKSPKTNISSDQITQNLTCITLSDASNTVVVGLLISLLLLAFQSNVTKMT